MDEFAHLGHTQMEYWKVWCYLCISVGGIFPSTLKCKVDSQFPSALSPDQNTQCILGGWRWVLSCPHLDALSLSNSPHARSLSSLRQQKGKKKRNKHQCWGRNIEYAHDARCLQQSPKMCNVSWRCDVCALCVYVHVFFCFFFTWSESWSDWHI